MRERAKNQADKERDREGHKEMREIGRKIKIEELRTK